MASSSVALDWACYGYGTGATLKAAQIAARQDFIGNKTVGALVYTDGQYADGSWWAEIGLRFLAGRYARRRETCDRCGTVR